MDIHGNISCCKGCLDRFVGCHANCEIYIKEKKAHDEIVEGKQARKKTFIDFELSKFRFRKRYEK
ncbi:hypothetical protein [Clostridium sp.]|uniref:hypothetical protein n=1 Tax=Clostridium sp. TaxID=1506 RepID=UPI001A406181|nr:hypothetical protein [Clostridium sp.]MBK5234087.1 hypothetical protein [Clostridium sp.]